MSAILRLFLGMDAIDNEVSSDLLIASKPIYFLNNTLEGLRLDWRR
jgi:hypothetical protein